MDKLILIDGNSLLNRAFYATPLFTTKDGMPTNGVFGFIKLLLKIISEKKPSHLMVAFDLRAPTFRHKIYSEYKAGRKSMPEELAVQLPILKEVLRLMNVKILEKEGYEADDIIGTIAKRFSIPTYIYTGDRDAYQLVDDTTTVCFTKKGVSDLLELTSENFKEIVGIYPKQIIDLKALMGDKSDNIPGVSGVGEKSAYKLLEEYGTLEGVYENIESIGGALNKKLVENKENAFFSYQLATIEVNTPIDVKLEEGVLLRPFPYAVKEKFAALEFKTLTSMNIFSEPKETVSFQQEECPKITINVLGDLNSALKLINDESVKMISCYYTSDSFEFCCITENGILNNSDYRLFIKYDLLSLGVFDYELEDLYRNIFQGKKKIIAYNTKELRWRLDKKGIEFTSSFDDVSILKCLADGSANTDLLDFCLNAASLPIDNKASGLYFLSQLYYDKLNNAEKTLYADVELPLSVVLFEMEKEGVAVDMEMISQLSNSYNAEIKQLTAKIYELAGETFNVNSTAQLGRILFDKLGIGDGKAKRTKASHNYKTTAEELEKYINEHEIISCLLRYRKVQKLVSTYLDGFKPLIDSTGKIHTTFNQINTTTGRLSSANPNLQNIPIRSDEAREIRKLFLASKGNVLIDADYSQIELRLMAHFSECEALIEAFKIGDDIHTITASQVFNIPPQEVTFDMRRAAKAVNFGILYGMSAFGLSEDLKIGTTDAQEFINRYFTKYSQVKTYIEETVRKAKETSTTTTLLGRRRVINELKSTNYNVRAAGERAAMNMPLQGSSADIIKIAMINVRNRLKNEGYQAKLILQVHDELIIDCPLNEADKVSLLLKEEMENAIELSVPLTVEVGQGTCWENAKK